MSTKVAQDALRRIANEIPELNQDQLAFIEDCLEDCFAVGQAWDDIPILIHEAKAPKATPKIRQVPQAAGSKS